jgi:chorismate mutase
MRKLSLFSWFTLLGVLALAPSVWADDAICTLEVEVAQPEDSQESLTKLFTVMKERFDLLEQVAEYKWNNKVPIEDLPREKQLLEEVAGDAGKYNLDKAFLLSFLQAQMNAAKQIQKNHFDKWKAAGLHGFDETKDLVKDLRPKLDKLRTPMLIELAKVRKMAEDKDSAELIASKAKEILTSSVIDENVIKTAIEPLLAMRTKPLVREQTP